MKLFGIIVVGILQEVLLQQIMIQYFIMGKTNLIESIINSIYQNQKSRVHRVNHGKVL